MSLFCLQKFLILKNTIMLVYDNGIFYSTPYNGLILKESIGVVIPSLFEALSLTVADAQYFGKPVICSDLPFFNSQPSDDLFFFNPHDENDIAKKMKTVLKRMRVTELRFDDQLEIQHREDLKNLSFRFSELYLNLIANQ